MKEFIIRFPHLMIQIIKKVDNKDLAKSREVTRTWQKFIDKENYPWLRIVKIPRILRDSTYTYLYLAASCGQIDTCEMILKIEGDENLFHNKGPSPFLVACHNGRVRVAEMFLKKLNKLKIILRKINNANLPDYLFKFEPSLIVETGFRIACEAGHFKVVETMICKSVSLELNLAAKDVFGRTGFQLACHAGHTNIVDLMIDKSETVNFDLTAKDLGGSTGFQHAVIFKNEDIINLIKLKMPCLVIYDYEAGKTPNSLGIMDHPFKTSANFTRFVGKFDQSLMDSSWDYVSIN